MKKEFWQTKINKGTIKKLRLYIDGAIKEQKMINAALGDRASEGFRKDGKPIKVTLENALLYDGIILELTYPTFTRRAHFGYGGGLKDTWIK